MARQAVSRTCAAPFFTYDLGSQGVEMLYHDHVPFDPGELGADAEPQDLAKRPKRDHELLIVS